MGYGPISPFSGKHTLSASNLGLWLIDVLSPNYFLWLLKLSTELPETVSLAWPSDTYILDK